MTRTPSRALATAPTGSRSIERAADLLVRIVEADEPLTVGGLAEAAALPKSTTSRLVAALERSRLVQRDERSAVRPGPVLVTYARRGRHDDLVALAGPALDRLAALSGETVNLGIATPSGVEQLDQRDSRHYLGSTNWVGRTSPLHASAVGKVFLAFGAVPLPAAPYERLATRTLRDRASLRRDLETTRARGYAVAVDELEPGLWAVAAPVFDANRAVAAALAISGPSIRLTDTMLDELGRSLLREAGELSDRLGYPDLTKGAA